MVVTAIIQQKKDTAKYNIFVDGTFAFALSMQDIAYFKLKEGVQIAQQTYDFIQENLIYIKAQDTALHYLGYQMRTQAQVRKKLEEKGFAEPVVERVMAFLSKYGYCDDMAYAKSYIRQCQKLRPKGAYVLKMELHQRGVAQEIVEQAIQEAGLCEIEDAAYWIRKKIKGSIEDLDEKEKRRLYGFLQRKGYRWDTIAEAMRMIQEEV